MESMVVKRSAPSLEHGRRVKIIMREAIMMLTMAVSVGYLIMWVMTGTHLYKTWSNNSGLHIPVLFIAVMSCVYLHLGKQVSDNSTERCNGKTHKFGSWKRPMIIKGLGIVCGIELAMFVMFIALLVWSFSAYLHIFSKVRWQVDSSPSSSFFADFCYFEDIDWLIHSLSSGDMIVINEELNARVHNLESNSVEVNAKIDLVLQQISRGGAQVEYRQGIKCSWRTIFAIWFVLVALSYTPTSIIFINVPSISRLQWHPFTISSSSNLEPDELSIIIKNEGSWSEKLYQMLSSPSPVDHLRMSIEGPYGPISTDFLRHDMLVMVSGGSGIAPFISITRDLIFTTSTLKSTTTAQILLISAFKFSSDLAMLDLLFPHSKTPSELLNFELHIEAYITREKQPILENEQKPLRTIRFKPNPSDAPLSPTLGPNGWLWLGAIVSSSFIVFLLFMGILTRFYIYPIDHNTNRVYSHTSQAMLNMLLVCIAIAMTGCVGFVWSKKQIAMEATKQVQDMEGGKLTRYGVGKPTSSVYWQT
ncbi:Ferric reduction oxidase 5 [Camellia lanceoleosa]|uniref:Ferric reduction oxidase 5 n=1 Tax=Camellia lanceoleosa TaxID=1840588 RepID=A0ACC0IN35_9ERIC|nr:Ferric reduction oxidase 5 [Camellia lanceoleosa]